MISLTRVSKALGISLADDDPGERAVQFFGCLPEMTGTRATEKKKIRVMPWQEEFLRKLYGTIQPDGLRQYRKAYIEIPRKQGKSSMVAGLILYSLLVEQEPSGELYSAGYDRDQARVVFRYAKGMIERMPAAVQKMVKVRDYYSKIEHPDSGAVYEAIDAQHSGAYGYNPSLIAFDELHAQKTRKLWDALETGMGAREQPLLLAITTAGTDRSSICWQVHEYAERVRDGIIEDPTFLPLIFAADENDDWTEPATWRKANPSLGVTVQESFLEAECQKAKKMPGAQNSFRRFYLDQWTAQTTRWINMQEWMACAGEYSEAEFYGLTAYGGLDLASRVDLAAFVLVVRDDSGAYNVLPWFWMPADNVEERTRDEGIPYATWVEQGFIKATPGNVIDFDTIEADIKAIAEHFQVEEVGYDDWNSEASAQHLDAANLTMVKVRQGMASLSRPSKELEALILSRKLRHPNNPVLNSHVDNVEIKMDENGNIRPVRPDERRLKIDGVVATIMALARATLEGEPLDFGDLLVL